MSSVIGKEPCPDCGSRDNLARYGDGHAWCFTPGCGRHEQGTNQTTEGRSKYVGDLIEGDYRTLAKRGINEDTLRKFDYRRGTFNGKPCHAATYHDLSGVAVAQKVRMPGKEFTWVGDPKRAGLYGQHLWAPGGRKLVITEGEIDALSVSQAQGNKWPVVSVPNGAQGAAKAVAKQLDWVETFDEVILMFDMDDPGRLAAKECAELLTPGRARIAELPLKDANDMLMAGKVQELIGVMWQAKVYRPDGILAGTDLWETVISNDESRCLPYPWLDLNEMTRGMRLGEIVTLCAGTGVGKSTACREIAYHLIQHGEKVGYVALEESVKRTALGFMSIELNRPLHLDRTGLNEADLRRAFDATLGTDRVYIYDHWGSIESEHLVLKIRQMVRGCGVQWIVLDHISIVVSGIESTNERKDLDVVMTRLRKLAQELNVGIFVVSHLRRKDGARGHEQGAEVSLSDLRGTQAIAQLSDMVIALERNQQDEEKPNVARVRVLKNRFTGETGVAGAVIYEKETGRLKQTDPFEEEESNAGDGKGSDAF